MGIHHPPLLFFLPSSSSSPPLLPPPPPPSSSSSLSPSLLLFILLLTEFVQCLFHFNLDDHSHQEPIWAHQRWFSMLVVELYSVFFQCSKIILLNNIKVCAKKTLLCIWRYYFKTVSFQLRINRVFILTICCVNTIIFSPLVIKAIQCTKMDVVPPLTLLVTTGYLLMLFFSTGRYRSDQILSSLWVGLHRCHHCPFLPW